MSFPSAGDSWKWAAGMAAAGGLLVVATAGMAWALTHGMDVQGLWVLAPAFLLYGVLGALALATYDKLRTHKDAYSDADMDRRASSESLAPFVAATLMLVAVPAGGAAVGKVGEEQMAWILVLPAIAVIVLTAYFAKYAAWAAKVRQRAQTDSTGALYFADGLPDEGI